MMALMVLVGMSDLRWIFGLGLLMIVQKHPVWGRRFAWPTAALLGSRGIAIETGWWTPDLASLLISYRYT
jgi:predicted metal-binding membrane protein